MKDEKDYQWILVSHMVIMTCETLYYQELLTECEACITKEWPKAGFETNGSQLATDQ